jgi:hypothetical protein
VTGTARSSTCITRSVRSSILQLHLGHPLLIFLTLYSIQCSSHIPAEVRPPVCYSFLGCSHTRHHDSCNPRRVFVHPLNLEQYIRGLLFLLVTLALTSGPTSTSPLWRTDRAAVGSLALILDIAVIKYEHGATGSLERSSSFVSTPCFPFPCRSDSFIVQGRFTRLPTTTTPRHAP